MNFLLYSSSSDDELSQLSSMDQSFWWVARSVSSAGCGLFANEMICCLYYSAEKTERGCDSKLAKEELYRQILVEDYDLSSSPEFQCFSPMIEEKCVFDIAMVLLLYVMAANIIVTLSTRGLPIEVRYQLPLALGTANETNKECTICQLRYGIGDHIVTLPCQHFFQYVRISVSISPTLDFLTDRHVQCVLCGQVAVESYVLPTVPNGGLARPGSRSAQHETQLY